ncbi:MAG: DNA mismatch repair endonuclease MutL [Bacteroidaceae bacterium]|nr:DNA mismatch repair endonuclease MutL [Bacteroidaceae bacterium]
MDIIQLLPDSVANQIAAGEVIQRPASVVKELVENAVDAGAHRIDVIAVDAGRTSLQVVDDGCGMSETDARLAFERHATSKIRQAADLFTLTTMGFRGEALPSIAAVAQVELTTRTAEADLGTHLSIEASRVISQEPVAAAVGSNFVIKNLFFNVPARRKFLKSNQTELSNISTEFERIVLVHPDIAFTLTHNDTTLLNLTPSTLKARIAAVFGGRIAERLLPVEVQTPMVRIHGFVGKPEASRKRGAQQYFFVNNRYMRHPYFHRAVQEAFTRLIPADEQVPYFIYFDVPPAEIDVNIHPTKTEIKFENEQAIWQILLAAIRESIGRFNAIPTIEFDTEGRPADIPVYNPNVNTQPKAPTVRLNPAFNPFDSTPSSTPFDGDILGNLPIPRTTSEPNDSAQLFPSASTPANSASPHEAAHETPLSVAGLTADTIPSTAFFQYRGQYVLTTVESGLLLIDQHRAHLRVLYDRYISQLAKSALPSQRYLFPEVMQLSAAQSVTFAAIHEDLSRLGFDVGDLGGGNISIVGYPAGFEGIDPQALFTEVLDTAATNGNLPAEQLLSQLALTLARAAAIPTGQVLSPLEMQDLTAQLMATSNPNYTPDGHPTLAIIPQEQIDKLF